MLTGQPPLGHIFVGRYSLPVPLGFVLLGAVVVVALSFVLIYLRPPAVGDETEELAGRVVPNWVVAGLTAFWTALIGFIVLEALFGRQDNLLFNPAAVLFWVLALPLVPLLHCIVGGLYEAGNPFAALSRRLSPRGRLANAERLIQRLGYWPAVAQLIVIVWGESVTQIVGSPRFLGVLGLVYVAGQVLMGTLLGPGWFRGGDVLQAVAQLASTVSVASLHRDERHKVVFVTGFDPGRALPWRPGREALITLWLAGVLADGLRQLPLWKLTIAPSLGSLVSAADNAVGSDVEDAVTITVEIAVAWILFSYFFWFFTLIAARLSAGGETGRLRRRVDKVAATVAPSIIPIAIAYLLAHNLTQIVVIGPFIVTAHGQPVAALPALYAAQLRHVSAAWVWWIQVTAIVVGHVVAVVMAHARLGQMFKDVKATLARNLALRADLGWLAAMLIYTATSLWIIAQPITA